MQHRGTVTFKENFDETIEDRYNRCGLLNVIQHIDIYGKTRSSYLEQPRSKLLDKALAVSCISSSAARYISNNSNNNRNVVEKLSKFTVVTKSSGLEPGHDVLSKRARKMRLMNKKNNFPFTGVPSRRLDLGE